MRDPVRRLAATDGGRRLLEVVARARSAPGPIGRLGRAADQAVAETMYDAAYYRTGGRDRTDGRSGYPDYRRDTSDADALAVMITTWLDVDAALDVGCAAGFFVEALRDLGIAAEGLDISDAAFELAAPSVRPHLQVADLGRGLPQGDRSVPLVTAFETLEHLRPEAVDAAVAELARVTSGYVVATIPSYGPNPSGPDGWFDGKVRPERLDHYRSAGPVGGGPVPHDDLARDAEGRLVEGHLTIASYDWWTARFADHGLVRCLDLERRMHVDLARYGLREHRCLYVIRRRELPEPTSPVRDADQVAELEHAHGLLEHSAPPHHVDEALCELRAAGLHPRG